MKKGMAVLAKDRCRSIAELQTILHTQANDTLVLFPNVGGQQPFIPQASGPRSEPNFSDYVQAIEQKRATQGTSRFPLSRTTMIAVILAIVLVMCTSSFLTVYMVNLSSCKNAAAADMYYLSSASLRFPTITKLHDPELVSYLNAGTYMKHGQYDKARRAYASLGSYRDSQFYAAEAAYQLAKSAWSDHDSNAVAAQCAWLAGLQNRDAEAAIDRIHALYTDEIMESIHTGQYYDVVQKMEALPSQVFDETSLASVEYALAEALYDDGQYALATDHFKAAGNYLDAEDRAKDAASMSSGNGLRASIDYSSYDLYIVDIEATEKLTLHVKADPNSSVVAMIPNGDYVYVISGKGNTYCRIYYPREGVEGYALYSHLSPIS